MVELSPVASTILVVYFVFASLLLLVLIAATAFLIWKLNDILQRYEARIEPVLEKADNVLTLIGEKTDSIGGKAELLLTQGEEMAGTVHEKVDRTATTVQRTINAPIIGANSLVAAFTEGVSTFARLQSRGKVSTEPTSDGRVSHIIGDKITEPAVETLDKSVVEGVPRGNTGVSVSSDPSSHTVTAIPVPTTPQETATQVVGRRS